MRSSATDELTLYIWQIKTGQQEITIRVQTFISVCKLSVEIDPQAEQRGDLQSQEAIVGCAFSALSYTIAQQKRPQL